MKYPLIYSGSYIICRKFHSAIVTINMTVVQRNIIIYIIHKYWFIHLENATQIMLFSPHKYDSFIFVLFVTHKHIFILIMTHTHTHIQHYSHMYE